LPPYASVAPFNREVMTNRTSVNLALGSGNIGGPPTSPTCPRHTSRKVARAESSGNLGRSAAVRSLSVDSALIDREAVVFRRDGHSDFTALRTKDGAERATSSPRATYSSSFEKRGPQRGECNALAPTKSPRAARGGAPARRPTVVFVYYDPRGTATGFQNRKRRHAERQAPRHHRYLRGLRAIAA
jgi:hypothetical protein